jgi:hypothetical protein
MEKLLFLPVVFVFFGCFSLNEQQPRPLSDDRFDGEFVYQYDYVAPDGINETHERLRFTFNKTNHAQWYHSYRSYDKGSNGIPDRGWNIWENYCPVKFEISNGLYRISEWDDYGGYEGEFTEWQPYSFSDDGDTLILEGYDFRLYSKRNYALEK